MCVMDGSADVHSTATLLGAFFQQQLLDEVACEGTLLCLWGNSGDAAFKDDADDLDRNQCTAAFS